jgi:hypothetical protein
MKINSYICTVKTKVRQNDVAETSGIFLCHNRNIIVRNRVGEWKHPKAFALWSLTARSADFFIYLSNFKVL